MNHNLKTDLANLDATLEIAKKQGIAYLQDLSIRPTSTKVLVTQNSHLPMEGIGSLAALDQFNQRLEPLMVALSGPRYWGFVTGGSTPASILGWKISLALTFCLKIPDA